jgi:hypothetical protein
MPAQRVKVNATLAAYVLPGVARVLGVTFKYPDRLTMPEAVQALGAFTGSAKMRDTIAKVEATPLGRQGVALHRQVLQYFALEHQADANGEPVPFDVPAFSGSNDPANPFKGMPPDHAASVIEWAQTQPEFNDARSDKGHPQHQILSEQWRQLHEAAFPGQSTGAPPGASQASATAPTISPARSGNRQPVVVDVDAKARGQRLTAELAAMPKSDPCRRALLDELVESTQRGTVMSGTVPAAGPSLTPPSEPTGSS